MKQIECRSHVLVFATLMLLALMAPLSGMAQAQSTSPATAALLEIEGPIGPATSDYFARAHRKAIEAQVSLIVVRIDTPGGLDTAMRDIIKVILSSPVPVVGYVAPSGARAASAGTYILYASHVAAMSPATNLGAATPVRIGGLPVPDSDKKDDKKPAGGDAMEKKIINDAVAYIRGLAERRGRNAVWAERAVREGASLPSHEALKLKVVDMVANDLDDLLLKLNDREIETVAGKTVLKTKGMLVQRMSPDWRSQFLAIITSPTLAVMLMLVGIYGLLLEGYNPGAIVPGVVGAICLLLALFAFQTLPINYAGVGLILLGVVLIVAEAFVPSFGALGLGGIAALAIGSVILIDTDLPGFGVNRGFIAGIAGGGAALMLLTLYLARRTRRLPPVSANVVQPGTEAEVLTFSEGRGWAKLHGEHWRISSTSGLQPGQRVQVEGADGLTLRVTPFPDQAAQ